MSKFKEIEIIRPDDWHSHLREDKLLQCIIKSSTRVLKRCIAMPNLLIPITSSFLCKEYKEKIKKITNNINVPTIGIGASVNCDGQVLVTDDLIGLNETNFRFVKKFGNVKEYIKRAVIKYKNSVKQKKFPSKNIIC